MTAYVDFSGSNGSGSYSSPFNNLQSAANADRDIVIKNGTYSGVIDETMSNKVGSSSNPYVIRPETVGSVTIRGNGSWSSDTDSVINIHRCDHFVVRDLKIHDATGGRGLSVFECEDGLIKNIETRDIFARCIGGSGHRIIVEDCDVRDGVMHNENQAKGSGGWASAISFTNWWTTGDENQDITIRNCHVEDVWGEGIGPWRIQGGTIEDNTIINSFSVGLYLNQIEDAVIQRNVIIMNDSTYHKDGSRAANNIQLSNEGLTTSQAYTKNLIIRNNLCYGGNRNLRFWYDNDVNNQTYDNIQVDYNNFLNPQSRTLDFDNVPGGNIQPSMSFRGNICEAGSSGFDDIGDEQEWILQDNLWWGGSVPSGSWASSSGNITGNPLLVNGSGTDPNNYKLTASSPCIDEITATFGYNFDFFGSARGTNKDIGFHEYDGTAPPPPEPEPETPGATGIFQPAGARTFMYITNRITRG